MQNAWRWFNEARLGLFIHWGAYAAVGHGEQSLFRDHLDQAAYAEAACRWNPTRFDPHRWAEVAADAGMRYAILTSRHHDGYCLWDSQYTDYTSARQAPGRDFVREYLEAFRAAGLRVGLYYSLADWRIPAYWDGPDRDPEGFAAFREYVHNQVRELLTDYGHLDVIWFDGAWPHSQEDWRSAELVDMIRSLQPHILINNRLGLAEDDAAEEDVGRSRTLGDFGTPEHQIVADPERMWESCQVSTWRLWGYATGERWRPADVLLDMLVEAAGKGGNLLLNVGPTPDGELPVEFVAQMARIGRWMERHGEAIYGSAAGDVTEFITYGRQTRVGNNLYLVIRFWDRRGEVRVAGLQTPVRRAVLLTTGQEVPVRQVGDVVTVTDLPQEPPTDLFPVIRLEFDEPPQAAPWAVDRLWQGDPARMSDWAALRGRSVWTDGLPRP